MKPLVTISGTSRDAEAGPGLLGGKAYQQLAAALEDLPVLPGTVLTTEAFPGRDWLLAQLHRPPSEQARAVERHLLSLRVDLPELLRSLPGRQFAFRSSANLEDSGAASFAGSFRTCLGIAPSDAYAAVYKVWASTFTPRVAQYVSDRDLSDGLAALRMAVLIQPMLDPLLSGVAFSHRLGQPDDPYVFVGIVRGLGEPLVEGRVNAQVYYIERGTWAIAAHDDAYDLPTVYECAGPLGRIVDHLEVARGAPQDVEFAIMHDLRLILLQNRPLAAAARRGLVEHEHV
jgi:phosphoenolpyruvate synthase/pyruvate phosphate dikinase